MPVILVTRLRLRDAAISARSPRCFCFLVSAQDGVGPCRGTHEGTRNSRDRLDWKQKSRL